MYVCMCVFNTVTLGNKLFNQNNAQCCRVSKLITYLLICTLYMQIIICNTQHLSVSVRLLKQTSVWIYITFHDTHLFTIDYHHGLYSPPSLTAVTLYTPTQPRNPLNVIAITLCIHPQPQNPLSCHFYTYPSTPKAHPI